MVRREGRFKALCESCGQPLERNDEGRWLAMASLGQVGGAGSALGGAPGR